MDGIFLILGVTVLTLPLSPIVSTTLLPIAGLTQLGMSMDIIQDVNTTYRDMRKHTFGQLVMEIV
jgi:hypothetical protein